MPLKRTIVEGQLVRGLNAGRRDPSLPADGNLRLENGVFPREGVIAKRTGLGRLAATHSEPWMGVFEDRPVLIGQTIKTFNGEIPTAGGFDTVYRDDAGASLLWPTTPAQEIAKQLSVDVDPIRSITDKGVFGMTVAVSEHVILCAYAEVDYDTGGTPYTAKAMTLDRYSKTVLYSKNLQSASSAAYEQAVAYRDLNGQLWVITYVNNAGAGTFHFHAVNNQTGAFGADTSIATATTIDVTNGQAGNRFDVCDVGSETAPHVMLAYLATTNTIHVCTVETTGTPSFVGQATPSGTHTTVTGIGCFRMGDNEACVTWSSLDGSSNRKVYIKGYAADGSTDTLGNAGAPLLLKDFGAVTDAVLCTTGTILSSSDRLNVYWTYQPAPGGGAYVQTEGCGVTVSGVTGTLVTPTVDNLFYGCSIVSKPFLDSNEEPHMLLGMVDAGALAASTNWHKQPKYFIAQMSADGAQAYSWQARTAMNALVQDGVAYPFSSLVSAAVFWTPVIPNVVDTDTWSIGIGRYLQPPTLLNQVLGNAMLTVRALTGPSMGRNKALSTSKGMVVPGALPLMFDGENLLEMGYLHDPVIVSASQAAGAGGQQHAIGDWGYRCVYESTDANGNVRRSGPSETHTVSITGTSDDNVTLTIATLKATRHYRDKVRIAVYRSIAADSDTFAFCGYVDNNTFADTVTFADANISNTTEARLYSDGELPNTAAPPFSLCCVWQNRLFVVDSENNASRLYHTKEFVDGVAPMFSKGFLYYQVPEDGGEITGLVAHDDKLIVFKRTMVYAVTGRPLDDNGRGDGLAPAFVVSATLGCTNAASVVNTPGGPMFLSESGIILLGRDLMPRPVGKDVEYHTDTKEIVDAVVVPEKTQVVFLTTSDAIVYNYWLGQWSTFTNYDATSGVYCNGRLYLKRYDATGADSYVLVEHDYYFDELQATGIQLLVSTGWFHFAGVAGFARLFKALIGGYKLGDHTLTVKIAYDGNPYWTDTLTLDTDDLAIFEHTEYFGAGTLTSRAAHVLEVLGTRQRCRSVRFEISDSVASATFSRVFVLVADEV